MLRAALRTNRSVLNPANEKSQQIKISMQCNANQANSGPSFVRSSPHVFLGSNVRIDKSAIKSSLLKQDPHHRMFEANSNLLHFLVLWQHRSNPFDSLQPNFIASHRLSTKRVRHSRTSVITQNKRKVKNPLITFTPSSIP